MADDGELGRVIGELFGPHQGPPQTPQQKSVGRACLGAGLFTGCVCMDVYAPRLFGVPFDEALNHSSSLMAGTFFAALFVGIGLVWIGERGAQEDPDRLFSAFWSGGLLAVLLFVLLSFHPFAQPWFEVGGVVAAAMLAMRLRLAFKKGRSAATPVQQNIAGKNPPIVAAKRRKF